MQEYETLQEPVRQFVAQYLTVSPEQLSPTTRIGEDLGVDGDDGVEFMQAFAEHFAVDLSGFEFTGTSGRKQAAIRLGTFSCGCSTEINFV